VTTISIAEDQINIAPDVAHSSPEITAGRVPDGRGIVAALLTTGWVLGHNNDAWSTTAALAAAVPTALAFVALITIGAGGRWRHRAFMAIAGISLAGLGI